MLGWVSLPAVFRLAHEALAHLDGLFGGHLDVGPHHLDGNLPIELAVHHQQDLSHRAPAQLLEHLVAAAWCSRLRLEPEPALAHARYP